MSDILDTLVAEARARSAHNQVHDPMSSIKQRLRRAGPTRNFRAALDTNEKPRVIAELKKASPSKGVLRADFRPVALAKALAGAGAAALSILTEEKHFQGSDLALRQVREVVDLPLLRKDFILDEYEVYRSKLLGADAVLLIAALMNETDLRKLIMAGREAEIDTLVEVHDEAEADRAVACGARLIGVNNRNLRTFEVSLDTSRRVASRLPAHVTKVSESGIRSSQDVRQLMQCGYRAFLIGEELMCSPQPGDRLREILS
ncbi:MAG: indole-3-glycerol phosphate synthase TrpC [Acidobacteria bacterium]|nr:indole-3-glycerol phosphate synthase TrpC [Acidobacteriota bacterium]